MRAQEIKTKAEKEKERETKSREKRETVEEVRKEKKARPRSKSSSATFRSVQIKIVANVFAGGDHDGSRRVTLLAATRGEESGAA